MFLFNLRRQRLKDATTVRRDEYELESLAIAKVDELCQDLRSAIDIVWVKEHLKERKIYEASIGRLERLEKSALIIWNKHTHLTSDQNEDYQEWLMTYKKDRDYKIHQRKQQIEKDYTMWRKNLGVEIKQLSENIRASFKFLVPFSFVYDIDATVEDNVYDLESVFNNHHQDLLNCFHYLKNKLEDYINEEVNRIDETRHYYHHNLLQEWREQLFRLDSSINRKIGGLKDMEADLEETVRLTVLQHEVENAVFEQLSSARMEHFWIDWRSKTNDLAKELTHKQEDYEVAKRSGKAKTRITPKERALEDLVELAKDTGSKKRQAATGKVDMPLNEEQPQEQIQMSDTMRLKIILEDIKPDIYRDFMHKITRSLERVKRDLGEGKRQYVPAFAVAKVIAMNCERFYDKAQLNERCVGRISFRGVMIFQEGLPMFAKSTFTLAATCAMLHFIPSKSVKNYKVDVEELFSMLDNIKVFFIIGLLTITSQYGEFGEYIMRSEALWLCSLMDLSPPVDLLQASLAKGLKESIPQSLHPSGVYSQDTVDLYNTLIELPTDLEGVTRLQEAYEKELYEHQHQHGNMNLPLVSDHNSSSFDQLSFGQESRASGKLNNLLIDNSSHFTEDPSRAQAYVTEPQDVYSTLKGKKVPLAEQMEKLRPLLPESDCFIFSAFLGRPEGSFDMTVHTICQVASIWRRTSISIATLALSPPSTEYPRIQDIITAHNASITGKKRMGQGNINCVSPYETISSCIDYLTSIHGLPMSFLQAMCLLGNGGSVDPWLEDPKQSCRHERIMYEVQEYLSLLAYRIPKSMIHDEYLQVVLPKNIEDMLKKLDLNFSGNMPLELVRTYLQRDDQNITNSQLSMIFWSLCRTNEDFDDSPQPPMNNAQTNPEQSAALVDATQSLTSNMFQSGGSGFRPVVATQFNADPEDYMIRFGQDVDKYLQSMPTIDTNVVLGNLATTLTPAAAHQLVSDAMKLDPSSRNPMPSTCCVWLGQRLIQLRDALSALVIPGKPSIEGNFLIGISEKAFGAQHILLRMQKDHTIDSDSVANDMFVQKLRTFVEVDLLSKYSEICEIQASDRHYGPAGNDPMMRSSHDGDDFHWKELLTRRINRLDRLTISWRDLMLSEWASSLYASRQMRYLQRVHMIQKSVAVYHNQYHALREKMLSARGGFMSLFRGLENELIASVQDDYSLITYHTSYVDRALRRFEGEYERFWTIIKDMMTHFISHAGKIKRYGIDRINHASETLREDLEKSCTGMIMGYTAGYAQGYFDNLIQRGEIWRQRLTDVQGQLIVMKEKFMAQKDEIDRDMTIQISDRLTLDRSRSKDHLDSLNLDTSQMLDLIANTRASYAALQKDANARLILRIEKSIRESRKLRVAAENQPEIEAAVLRDIREVLNTAKHQCVQILNQIRDNCMKQLMTIEPMRPPHRQKMEKKVQKIQANWDEVAKVAFSLVDDYEFQVLKQLQSMNFQCLDYIHSYRDHEMQALQKMYKIERELLILSFRKHFRDYDLSEAAIFEKFDREVHATVNDMITLWGPSRPKFIKNGLRELQNIATESLLSSQQDIHQQMFVRNINDDFSGSRYEIADIFSFNLLKSYEYTKRISGQYIKEKEDQIVFIEEMSMEKNGDMVRPQVKAVLDLLISGIEIDCDFNTGYDNLVVATSTKSKDSELELLDFMSRYSKPDYPVSVPHTAFLTRQRILSRKAEVDALLEASRAHIVADHSKLDVLMNAGKKDIEEWYNLTSQLIENAFHNAELNYLSNLWPTPEPTPRLELIPEDEDRVGKLKALLAETQKGVIDKSRMIDVNHPSSQFSPSRDNIAMYKGDANLLLQNLFPSEQEEEEARLKKERKREEREKRRKELDAEEAKEREVQAVKNKVRMVELPDGIKVPELKTKELQDGWFECIAPEGYLYYHNPATDESLWDLPQALKKPKRDDDEDSVTGSITEKKLIDTPRELLMLEVANVLGVETAPIRIVPETFRLNIKVDPKVVMAEVAEEARAVAAFVTDTALDVTDLIYGKLGRDEKTIAALLGDRYNAEALKKFQLDMHSDEEDAQMLRKFRGEEGEEDSTVDDRVKLNDKGRVLMSDNGSDVDVELNEMLKDLGIGVKKPLDVHPMLSINDGVDNASSPTDIVKPAEWLNLGMGDQPTRGDLEVDSSDGEDYTGFHENANRRKLEVKYQQQREIDLMMKEDDLSIAIENAIENENCHNFLEAFSNIIETETATEEDKLALQKMGAKIKPINMIEIMKELETSWNEVDEIIQETKEREIQRQFEVDEMKTKEGLQRQKMIVEHAEDIQDMANFLFQSNLSKVTSKRVATDLVLKQIATPKKLAKIWSRKQISLKDDLKLDTDDIEELEQALQVILLGSSVSTGDLHALEGGGSGVLAQPSVGSFYAGAGYSPFISQQVPQTQHVLENTYPTVTHTLETPELAANKPQTLVEKSAPPLKRHASLHLDPNIVTEVEYEDDEEEENKIKISSPVEDATNKSPSYVITKEGYKSFRGGWIEGVTENNETYYYNIKSGQSAWNLPDLIEQEVDDPVESLDNVPTVATVDDPNAYYDENAYNASNDLNAVQSYNADSNWNMSDALGIDHIDDYVPPPKPRAIPSYQTLEATAYAKREGVARQLNLLQQQDRWQNALVKTQHIITEQKSKFLNKRVEMFDKVTERVEARLNAFIEDIKFMQKTLKKELGEANATERDLRRLFEEEPSTSTDIVKAEKLSFILESLEKLKVSVSEKYDSAFKQIDKFAAEWELIKSELSQIGEIYDEGILSNLEQCKLVCEHNSKLFVKDQLKQTAHIERVELKLFRIALRKEFIGDTLESEYMRDSKRSEQLVYYYDREKYKEQLRRELYPQSMGMNETVNKYLEEELVNNYQSYPLDKMDDMLTEEELAMSYMLTQLEMENSLQQDYGSIILATKSMANELQETINDFDETEKSVSVIQFSKIVLFVTFYFSRQFVRTEAGSTSTEIL